MKTFKRTKLTLIYFLTPCFVFLAWLLLTRDYSGYRAFLWSFADLKSAVLAVIAFYFVFKACRVLNCIRLYKKFIGFVDPNKHMVVFDGCPGTGKTSSTSEYCVVLSMLRWEKICYDYWLLRNTRNKWQGNSKNELDLTDNRTAHCFWAADKSFVPCLYSNIDNYDLKNKVVSGMTVGNQKVRYFTKGMLDQRQKIPFGSVIHLEEIGDWIGNEWSNAKDLLEGVSKNARFCRHYGFMFVINDQDCQNIFINVRRSVAQNQLLLKQKWICRPTFLLLTSSFLKWFVRVFRYRDMPRFANFLRKFDKLIGVMGFRKYWSILSGNTQTGAGDSQGKFNYCIPSTLLASYDDRYKRTQYNPKQT